MNGFRQSVVVVLLMFVVGGCATQPGISSNDIDALVTDAMREFSVPGAAVGVIKDGVIVHATGYGVREMGQRGQVDSQTMFRIASMTKGMTTAALAMLVDEGKLGWDDKVVDHIPDFQMFDPWVTQAFTVTDLVAHRSGLRAYVGDLMLWPKPNDYTRGDIIHGLRYFEPVSDFRTQYDYDNLLYVVAGEIFPAVSGHEWEEFIDERLLARFDSERCFAGRIPEQEMQNLAVPHATVEGTLQVIDRNRISDKSSVDAAAGGVRCSLDDMLKWTQVVLARGALPDGSQLFSRDQSAFMWRPVTFLSVSQKALEQDRTHFNAYGLGWELTDVHGYKQVHKTGSFTGFHNYTVLIPELDLGVVVMINASASEARQAITKGIIRPYLGAPEVDWVEYYSREQEPVSSEKPVAEPVLIDYENGSVLAPMLAYTGKYSDPWFGEVSISLVDDELWFTSAKSQRITGRLWPQHEHTFIARWSDRSVNADAYVMFEQGESGKTTGITMRAVSKDTEIDYMELDFTRVAGE